MATDVFVEEMKFSPKTRAGTCSTIASSCDPRSPVSTISSTPKQRQPKTPVKSGGKSPKKLPAVPKPPVVSSGPKEMRHLVHRLSPRDVQHREWARKRYFRKVFHKLAGHTLRTMNPKHPRPRKVVSIEITKPHIKGRTNLDLYLISESRYLLKWTPFLLNRKRTLKQLRKLGMDKMARLARDIRHMNGKQLAKRFNAKLVPLKAVPSRSRRLYGLKKSKLRHLKKMRLHGLKKMKLFVPLVDGSGKKGYVITELGGSYSSKNRQHAGISARGSKCSRCVIPKSRLLKKLKKKGGKKMKKGKNVKKA